MTDQEQITALLMHTGRAGIERVIAYLSQSDYFTTGCATHHRRPGGLARHSLEVYHAMMQEGAEALNPTAITITALLHDIATANHAETQGIRGHGARSLAILQAFCSLELTEQEADAIEYHMNPQAVEIQGNQLAEALIMADKDSSKNDVFFSTILQRDIIRTLNRELSREGRWEKFVQLADTLSPQDFAAGLSYAFLSGRAEKASAVALFNRAIKKYCMLPEDFETYKDLPDPVTIYRGCFVEEYENRNYGLSWTGSRAVAEWYAWKRDPKARNRIVITTTIRAREAIAYYNIHEHHEIVADISPLAAVEIARKEPSARFFAIAQYFNSANKIIYL